MTSQNSFAFDLGVATQTLLHERGETIDEFARRARVKKDNTFEVLRALTIVRPPSQDESTEEEELLDTIERIAKVSERQRAKEWSVREAPVAWDALRHDLNERPEEERPPLSTLSRVSIVRGGDVTRASCDLVVNAANSGALGCFAPSHRCVDNVLHWAAGPRLRRACQQELDRLGWGRVEEGHLIVTKAFALPSQHVAHVVGPSLQKGEQLLSSHVDLLLTAYRNIFQAATDLGAQTIAIPSVSTGIFGFPRAVAARVALAASHEWLSAPDRVDNPNLRVSLLAWEARDEAAYLEAVKGHFPTFILPLLNVKREKQMEGGTEEELGIKSKRETNSTSTVHSPSISLPVGLSSFHGPEVARVREWLSSSPNVLILAGAGMSAAAGIDYTSEDLFRKHFPAMAKRGFRCFYQFIGHRFQDERLKWGYFADQVDLVRFSFPHSRVYSDLFEIVDKKKYFVRTSNVDGQFRRHGFDPDRICEPQGDYALFQCLTPCSQELWSTKDILIDPVKPTVDEDQRCSAEAVKKVRCPKCGGAAFMNVRGGRWFIESERQKELEKDYRAWLAGVRDRDEPLVILSIGAGYNTPTVIRWEAERVALSIPRSKLVRINPIEPQIDDEDLQLQTDKCVSFQFSANLAMAALAGKPDAARDDAFWNP